MTNIEKYEVACGGIAKEFSNKYADGDFYYIGGDIGGICSIGDFYLDAHAMAMVLKLNPTLDKFLDAYYEHIDTKGEVSLRNLIKYGVKQMSEITKKTSLEEKSQEIMKEGL